MTKSAKRTASDNSQRIVDALTWVYRRAQYANDFAGVEVRKEIMAEIERVALGALK